MGHISKNLLAAITLILTCFFTKVAAQHFAPLAKTSKIEFHLTSHRGEEQLVKGTLGGLKGKITFDPKDLSPASFDITLSTGSINTGLPARDQGLKKEPFFNPAKYPIIHIKSTSVTQDKPGGVVYTLHGNLTMNGVTKLVNIQFMATHTGEAYLFRGSLEVSRLAFNIGTKEDKIDDMVSVFIEVRTEKSK